MWELFSLGCRPYKHEAREINIELTQLGHVQLLKLLRSGVRLQMPRLCTPQVYEIMEDCWLADPELRPTFAQLLNRLLELI